MYSSRRAVPLRDSVGFDEKLNLYRLSVQHPLAEASFLERVCAHYRRGVVATLLREDFAGTAAVASAWVAVVSGTERRALAVDNHGPTVRWAQRRAARELGERARDIHIIQADVMRVRRPRVDIVAALNFSTFIYHDRDSLRGYFVNAKRSLLPGGVLVIDAYGGPGAMRVGVQKRPVNPLPQDGVAPFEYQWEQRSYNAVTGRVDCRIHFVVPGTRGVRARVLRDAFVYDWRLWTLPELTELMREAGFARSEVWCDRPRPRNPRNPRNFRNRKPHDGRYRPMNHIEPREDWVAYVVGS